MEQQLALSERPAEMQAMDPMQMIQLAFQEAIKRGDGLQVVDRILEQQKWMIQHNEEEAFTAALRRIQDKLKAVPKRGFNPQTNSHFAKLEDIDKEIEPLIRAENMTLSFEPQPSEQPQMVRVVGVLSLGAYSRRYPLDMPTDGQGAKGGGVMTRTHATGSGIAYGIRYIKRMIFNLRLEDDDGNKASGAKSQSLDERSQINHLENIRNAGNKAELQRLYLSALTAAESIGDAGSIKAFIAAKDKRYKEML